ncbi:Hypothetical predicted protein [Pelobates cultripes]|uniref:Uncharacterized protein n=1 Tax=Pelobates cultripes TaxID=61616 RepID=A0AAD1VR63_PELCU|nr:Hypothetical predicted protein [Pelobates cultripes]
MQTACSQDRHPDTKDDIMADAMCTSEFYTEVPDYSTRLNAILETFLVKLESRARQLKECTRPSRKKSKQHRELLLYLTVLQDGAAERNASRLQASTRGDTMHDSEDTECCKPSIHPATNRVKLVSRERHVALHHTGRRQSQG